MADRNSIERSKIRYGDDIIDMTRGTDGDDRLEGGEGRDYIFAYDGDDYLDGGEGDDLLEGMTGDDEVYGGAGDDRLTGGAGDDELYGGEGDDELYGYPGDDRLDGGAGDDRLEGWAGNDQLYGGAGNDWLIGNQGNDQLEGGAGDDLLYGREGRDRLYGGEGDDELLGGAGSDILRGGAGADTISYLSSDAPVDIRLSTGHASGGHAKGDAFSEVENIIGSYYNDRLDGDANDNELTGGGGADTLTGGAGTDIFRFNRGDSLGNGDVITDFRVAGANRDALDLRAFNIDLARDLESQGLTLSGLMDADGDGATDDRKITLPDGGIITLLNLGSEALAIDDFTFAGGDGALTNVDAGDDPAGQPGPDPEGQPGPEPGGNGGALTNVDAGDDAGVNIWRSHWRSHLQEVVTSGGLTGRLDAGDLSIGGGVDLPASDDSLHRSNYHLYYRAEGGSYFLRFDDAITADLPVSATAAQVDAALEGLDGVTSAEVTGEPGNFIIALTADEPHVLQWGDLRLDGDGQLDYLAEPPADDGDSGAYNSRYELYWDDDPGGEFQLRLGDETTGALPPNPTAAAIDAALESLDGVVNAEVVGEPGGWTLEITADTGDVLQAIEIGVGFVDNNLGNLQLDYIGGNLQLDYI